MSTISFARGAPSLDIVDVEGLREAAQLAFDNDPGGTVAYGTSVGYVPLREWIAEQHGVAVEQVLVTNGSMQADAFLFELLVDARRPRGRRVADLRPHAAQPAQPRADLHMVDLETDGIDTAALRSLLEAGVKPKLAHIIPNFQNPAGYTLSRQKRGELLRLAAEHDFTIFEDDPYVAIRFEGEPLPTMLEQDDAGKVVYASSFSKTVCPGIRVGYLVGPQAIIKQIQGIATNTYISPNMVAQSIVNQFARSGRMDGAIATVKNALRERRDALVAALRARAARGPLHAAVGRLLHVGRAARGHRRGRARARRQGARRRCSSRAPTSSSRAARTPCASPTPASRPSRSTRASRASPRPCTVLGVASLSGATTGRTRSQFCELFRPDGASPPRAVLLHGGFWRARYGRTLMHPVCRDLAARGWAAWNVEYRRLGRPAAACPRRSRTSSRRRRRSRSPRAAASRSATVPAAISPPTWRAACRSTAS